MFLRGKISMALPRHEVVLPKGMEVFFMDFLIKRKIWNGAEAEDFKKKLKSYFNVKYVVLTSSARLSLYLGLKVLAEEKKQREVILPVYNYYIIPYILHWAGFKPVFVDIDETGNINPYLIEEKINSNTCAVLPGHLFGNPSQLDFIYELSKKYNIKIIEDCAHAAGSLYNNRPVGSQGSFSILSFGMGKNLFCLGGGAFLTNDEQFAKRVEKRLNVLPQMGMEKIIQSFLAGKIVNALTKLGNFTFIVYPFIRLFSSLGLDLLGINFLSRTSPNGNLPQKYIHKFTNFQAQIGLKQLEMQEIYCKIRRQNAEILSENLKNIRGIEVLPVYKNSKPNYLYYFVKLKDNINPAWLKRKLLMHGIDCKIDDNVICSKLTPFKEFKYYTKAEESSGRLLKIPNGIYLSEKDLLGTVEKIKEAITP